MTVLQFGKLFLDDETQILEAPRGTVRLPHHYYRVMAILMRRGNKITTSEMIVFEIWQYPREEPEGSMSTIRCIIKDLRGFIKLAGGAHYNIRSERGCGYFLEDKQVRTLTRMGIR